MHSIISVDEMSSVVLLVVSRVVVVRALGQLDARHRPHHKVPENRQRLQNVRVITRRAE